MFRSRGRSLTGEDGFCDRRLPRRRANLRRGKAARSPELARGKPLLLLADGPAHNHLEKVARFYSAHRLPSKAFSYLDRSLPQCAPLSLQTAARGIARARERLLAHCEPMANTFQAR